MDMKAISMIAMIMIVLTAGSALIMTVEGENDIPINMQDAYIVGKVVNGTSGIKVSCRTINTPMGAGSNPFTMYFNGTTNATGQFNITVDSNATALPPDYLLDKYSVTIFRTYYLDVSKGSYILANHIEKGDEAQVPDGALEMTPTATGDVTVRILNKTSGEPLEDVTVTLDHPPGPPPIPFNKVKVTDSAGEVVYNNVRADDIIIEGTRVNFLDLSSTVSENIGAVAEGTMTVLEFNLTEKPWPFLTTPSPGSQTANITEGVLINFQTAMDPSSITSKSNYMFEDGLGTPVPFSIVSVGTGNDKVRIVPDEQMEYDSDYILYILRSIRSQGGWNQLWRNMDVNFHTELRPGIVQGRILETGSGMPVQGISVELVDQTAISDPDGIFHFPVVIPGLHDLRIDDSYLYDGVSVADIDVKRGDDLDLGNISIAPLSHGSMRVTVTSDGSPFEGAWVKVLSSLLSQDEMNMTTNSTGVAYFERVRSGNVNLRVGADHYSPRIDIALIPEGGTGNLSIELFEDDPPIIVQLTEEVAPGFADPSSDFLLLMPEPIDFQTLVVSLWKLQDGERISEVPLFPPQTGSVQDSYLVRVQGNLPLESDMELIVDDGLLALNGSEPVLWEDLIYKFSTPLLPLSYIVGKVLLEGKPLEDLEVRFQDQIGYTDDEGNLNISIDLSTLSLTGKLIVNMTDMGYSLFQKEITITPGSLVNIGELTILPLSGWYSVSPIPGSMDVDPETNIIFSFTLEPMVPGNWSDVLKVVKEGMSAPLTGIFTSSNGNKTVTFDPFSSLDRNTVYRVTVSKGLMQKGGIPMFPVGNTTSFRVLPPEITIEVLSPTITEDVALDVQVRLSFGVSQNRSLVQSSLDISPTVTGISFHWVSGSELIIEAFFTASENYTLSLAPGIYGSQGEPLTSSFQLQFSTGTSYSMDHSFTSINLIPEPDAGWNTGQSVRVSGTADHSAGYEVKVTIGDREWTSTVNAGGIWSVELILPDTGMKGTMRVSIGVPGGPEAHFKEYSIEIKENKNGTTDDGTDLTLIFIIASVLVILLAVIAGLLFIRSQKKKAEMEMDIDYTEVDGEWDDGEE